MGDVVPINELRMLSDLVSRANLASAAGITFGGKRDLYKALGYNKTLTATDYRERFKRNAIANRIVKAFPKATWRGRPEIVEDEDPNTETEFERIWKELDKRLHVWSVFQRADILAGIGRYSVILLGAEGRLSEPLPDNMGPDKLLFLATYSEEDMTVKDWVDDAEDPRFGRPFMYRFQRTRSGKGRTSGADLIHYSRILHIAEGVLDEQSHGEPRLECVWNLLDDLEKVTGGGAEAFWMRVNQGYQFDVEKDIKLTEAEKLALQNETDEFVNNIRRILRTRGMKINVMGSDVSNFDKNSDALLTQISGGTGIPKRILTGSEMGELASSQDQENFNERVEERRLEFAEDSVIRPFVDVLQAHGVLPDVEDYSVRWPEMTQSDDEQRADVADKLAGLNSKMGETVITGAEIRDRVLELPPLEEVVDDNLTEEEMLSIEDEPPDRELKKSFRM